MDTMPQNGKRKVTVNEGKEGNQGRKSIGADDTGSDGDISSSIPVSEPSISPVPSGSFTGVHYGAFEVHNPSTGGRSEVRLNSSVKVNAGLEGGNFFLAVVEDIFSEGGKMDGEGGADGGGARKRRRTTNTDVSRRLITVKDMESAKVRLRWYFQARDVPSLGISPSTSPEAKDLIDALSKPNSNGSRNVALSELRDVNPLDVILGPVDIPRDVVVSHSMSIVSGSEPPRWQISKFIGGVGGGSGGDNEGENGREDSEDGVEGDDSDSDDSTTSSSSDDSNAGKIYIGQNHQAVVPEIIAKYQPERPPPTQVWKPEPNEVNPKRLKRYISSCYDIIKSAVPESSDYNLKSQNNEATFEDNLDFGDTVHPCDVSVLLEILALNAYDIGKAKADVVSRVAESVEEMMKKKAGEETGQIVKDAVKEDASNKTTRIPTSPPTSPSPTPSTSTITSETPLSYSDPSPKLVLFWTKNEKTLFDAGFKKHSGQLRNISLGLPSKSTCEVIDFHYRFKIPSQYRKYVEKKRTNSTTSNATSSRDTPVATQPSSSSNSPFDNPSGLNPYSASARAMDQKRHKQAKSFLSQCRRQLGPDAYLNVVNLLKSYSRKSIQMKTLRDKVVKVIGKGELTKSFDSFLPKKHRGSGEL